MAPFRITGSAQGAAEQADPMTLWVLELPGEEDTIVCNFESCLVRAWLSEGAALRARDSYPGEWMGAEPIASYRASLRTMDEIKALGFRCRGVLLTSDEWAQIGREYWR
ncbi:MAG: hypothetical protein ACO1SV_21780 [Fimbriimonas sp.]